MAVFSGILMRQPLVPQTAVLLRQSRLADSWEPQDQGLWSGSSGAESTIRAAWTWPCHCRLAHAACCMPSLQLDLFSSAMQAANKTPHDSNEKASSSVLACFVYCLRLEGPLNIGPFEQRWMAHALHILSTSKCLLCSCRLPVYTYRCF